MYSVTKGELEFLIFLPPPATLSGLPKTELLKPLQSHSQVYHWVIQE